jgi:hypothetical protein
MDTEHNAITPSSTKAKCPYCASYLVPEAIVCTVCNRYRKWYYNHLRIDHASIVIAVITIIFTCSNLELARENFNESKQKRVEATAALEQAQEAAQKVASLQTVLNDAQTTLSELRSSFDFSILQIKASNDDRQAFERLTEIAQNPGPLHDLAWNSIWQIRDDIENSASKIYMFTSRYYNINTSKMSLEEFRANYYSIETIDKPAYLVSFWYQKRFSTFDRLQFLYGVIKITGSLRELYKACELMNYEAKIYKSFFKANEYIQWWEQNKSKYETSVE